jgi:hypothetical protein
MSLHELWQRQHSLHSRQLPSTAAFLMSFSNNNSLITECSIATAGFYSTATAANSLFIVAITAIL